MNTLLQIKDNQTNEYHNIKVISYSVTYDKVWGSSVKNMEGSTRATLIGILPVIKASTEPLYQHQVNQINSLLSQGYFSVKFYDSGSGTYQEELYTSSDISVDMIRENGKWYEEIGFTLTPIDTQGIVS